MHDELDVYTDAQIERALDRILDEIEAADRAIHRLRHMSAAAWHEGLDELFELETDR